MKTFETKPIDPTSLNGVNVFTITVVGGGKVNIQPVLMTTSTLLVHCLATSTAAHPGATVALLKGSRCLTNLGDFDVNFPTQGTWYIHGVLTTAANVVTNGGAADYIYVSKELG